MVKTGMVYKGPPLTDRVTKSEGVTGTAQLVLRTWEMDFALCEVALNHNF